MLKHHLFAQVSGKQWEATQRKRITPACVSWEICFFSNWDEQCFACAGTRQIGQGDTARVWEDKCSESATIGFSASCRYHPSSLQASHLLTGPNYSMHTLIILRAETWKPRLTISIWQKLISCEDISAHARHGNRLCIPLP